MVKFFHVCTLLSVALLGQALPTSFITSQDKSRFKQVFSAGMNHPDLGTVAYSVMGYALLGEPIGNQEVLCKKLQSFILVKPVSLYQATSAAKLLKSCKITPTPEAMKLISDNLGSEESVPDLFYSAMTLLNLGNKLDEAKTMKTLQASLKKDDSLSNLGFAFHLAAHLSVNVDQIFDRIEDAIVQADEVDGKMLQFEGGLSVTSWIISGAYKLADKVNKTPTITPAQAVKFADYFLSRKSVYVAKGCFKLLDVVSILTKNKFHIPVSISLFSPPTVSETSPMVKFKVADLMGKSLGKMDVVVESGVRQSDGAIILSKTKAAPVEGDESLYEINMWTAKPGRGFYKLSVNAKPVSGSADRLVGNSGAVLQVKALSSIELTDVEIGIAYADHTFSPKFTSLNYPSKLSKPLEADHHHKIMLEFVVKDKASGEKIRVHQAFVRLENVESGGEIIFVAEADANNVYKFDLDVNGKSKLFNSRSGQYKVHLIIGDAVISNAVWWHMTDMDLRFAATTTTTTESDASPEAGPQASDNTSGPLPEIRHKFREPEKRPPVIVSNAFTVLCLLPIFIMLIGWLKLGIRASNFSISFSSTGFHNSLGAIFALFFFFWLQLDMFTTIKYLAMIGMVTFLFGNSLLVKLAEKRKQL